jgi:hypothetical protein
MTSNRWLEAYRARTILQFSAKLLSSHSQRKHLLQWLHSLRNNYLLDTPFPWMTFDAVHFVKDRLLPGARVFEYGSGGSTLFWLRTAALCVSIEHDPLWFNVVKKRVSTSALIDYRLVLPEPAEATAGDAADPFCYQSNDREFQGYTFHTYASQIDSFPNNYFDLVLVDGRARPSCIMHSAPKIKMGGLLIVDNADREYYTQMTRCFIGDFSRFEFRGVGPVNPVFWRTDIYVKDSSQ